MTITFHGAAGTVTGSKHLIKLNNGTQLLLDCGMFQGRGDETDELNEHFGFNPEEVNYLILSHAHIDHCGLIPRLVAQGFKGTIFSTAATMDLARILLNDSAGIQKNDTDYINKKEARAGRSPVEPLYTEEDVMKAMRLFKIVEYNEDYEIDCRVKFCFTDAGHILGSAAVNLSILEDARFTQITFSGDLGSYDDMLLKSPQPFPQADYIILESTYGDSYHKDLEPIEGQLLEIVTQTCLVKRGKLIIPAFSVGRTQELLYALNALELNGTLPDVPFYVDSPLSLKATEVLKEHIEVYNNKVQEVLKRDEDIFQFKGLKFIQNVEESKRLNDDPRPCVIISSSGMAEAGRVKHHMRNNIQNNKNTILLVGYCEPKSLGGQLMSGKKIVQIFGDDYDVRAEVKVIRSMSAHGDCADLLQFLSCQDPKEVKQIYLVHGENKVQESFRAKLLEVGFSSVIIPAQHQVESLAFKEVIQN
ncbi:MBL fold metallo-hydrolase RNA specificity domain-containing protein [Arcticibacter eurypsychrophilus]|uniref:MBL fold metallo-hydrolase RNA specificity domain-containing protein n=1 Tax=Arcticibacter eurypsychrophilus TaxID=1434752 RepID=UPI00084D0642|nr:MBL fold metallo-hydrolase [Arcticibacter eurypsychrophilus]